MQVMATTRDSKIPTTDLQFAEEVMEVYRLGDQPLPKLSSPSMKRLYEWVQNPENFDVFIKQTVKQATEILAKHRQPEEQSFVITPEKKGIGELEEFLRQHIAESQLKAQHEPAQRHPHTWTDRKRPSTIDPSLLTGVQSSGQIGEQDRGSGNIGGANQQERIEPTG